jgi:DNA-directed RNA polymerase specialized sigma subunit
VKTFDAVATREGKWWVVQVNGVGATQGRTTDEAEQMAVDLVVAMRGLESNEVEVNIDFHLPGDGDKQVAEAREAHRKALVAMEAAAAKIRSALGMVLATGITKKDAARLLRVSPQRVSQLSKRLTKH